MAKCNVNPRAGTVIIFIPCHSQVYQTSDREGRERLDRGQFRERDIWAETLRVVGREKRRGRKSQTSKKRERDTREKARLRSCYEGNNGRRKEGDTQRLANTVMLNRQGGELQDKSTNWEPRRRNKRRENPKHKTYPKIPP